MKAFQICPTVLLVLLSVSTARADGGSSDGAVLPECMNSSKIDRFVEEIGALTKSIQADATPSELHVTQKELDFRTDEIRHDLEYQRCQAMAQETQQAKSEGRPRSAAILCELYGQATGQYNRDFTRREELIRDKLKRIHDGLNDSCELKTRPDFWSVARSGLMDMSSLSQHGMEGQYLCPGTAVVKIKPFEVSSEATDGPDLIRSIEVTRGIRDPSIREETIKTLNQCLSKNKAPAGPSDKPAAPLEKENASDSADEPSADTQN